MGPFLTSASCAHGAERLLFDREVTLTAKETAFAPEFSDLTAPVDFRNGTLHARYEVRKLAATGRTVALQFCLKAPDGAHTCLPCVEVREPGVHAIERPLAKLFKSAPITYDRLASALLVAKAESCRNHDEPAGPLRAEYYPLTVRVTVVAVSAGAVFSGWPHYAPDAPPPAAAAAAARALELRWIDVEGGGATLLVTPAGESVLIDSGNPGGRDAGRIRRAVQDAGLTRIDRYVTTHFHSDHCGGAAELAESMEIGEVYDNGIPVGHPDGRVGDPRWPLLAKSYREFKAGARHVLSAGDEIPLRQLAGGPPVRLRCLAARRQFAPAPAAAPNPRCAGATTQPPDTTDNANSIVLLLDYGGFRFFAGGDLTWNHEGALVCPVDRVGEVDVYQVDHHGLDVSNNPLLVHTLAPTVAVMSNGAKKGAAAATFATLRASPGLQAIYQSHKSVRPDAGEQAPDECIANFDTAACAGHLILLTVASDARSYTVSIPATGHRRTFSTRRH